LAATEAAILGSLVDGAIIVYQVGIIARGALKRAKAQLDHVGVRILGVVLNGLKADISPDFAYRDKKYYYYYGDKKPERPSLKDRIIAFPETVTHYLKSIISKVSVKREAPAPLSPPVIPAIAAPAPAIEAETEPIQQEDAQKVTAEKSEVKISRSKIVILLLALMFMILGILYQTGVVQYDFENILPWLESLKPVVEEKKPVPESIQPPATAGQSAPAKDALPTQAAVSKATDDKDWGVILYVKDRTNIRADRSINSRITAKLEPGQKVKADFLEDEWYAVFDPTETKRDEKGALGYVYSPRLSPPEAIQAQQATVPQSAKDWGIIFYVKDRTNIRADRSINSKVRGTLEPGQKVKADFLEDEWYAVFKIKETKRDIKRALGYVYSPRLSPLEAAGKN
jgi:hypothetical protein